MGKNKNRNKQQPKSALATLVAPAPSPETKVVSLVEEAGRLHAAALEGVSEADLERMTRPEPSPAPASAANLEEAVQKVRQAQDLFLARDEKLKELQQSLEERRALVEARVLELDRRETQVREEEDRRVEHSAGLRQKEDGLLRREAELLTREESVRARELDADAGFVAQRRRMLKQLDEETTELQRQAEEAQRLRLEERARSEKERAEEREAREAVLKCEREAHEGRLKVEREAQEEVLKKGREAQEHRLKAEREAQEEALRKKREAHEVKEREEQRRREEQEDALSGRERELVQQQKQLRWDRESLTDDRENLERRVEERLEVRKREIEDELERARKDRDRVHEERNRLADTLTAREEMDRRFGNQPPEEVLGELRSLREERDRLKTQLASRLGEDAEQQLQALQREKQDWLTERLHLLRQTQELDARLSGAQVAVTKLETLRDEKAALESSRALLQSTLERLREDVKKNIHGAEHASAFPALSGMDANPNLQEAQAVADEPLDLKALVLELQQRMASDPATGNALYYSEREIRSFLAGLAMSRLHLLQGISGTGKSSLPQAFARTMRAGVTLVEVQAGWRDRQDLIGHFNAFDRRYHETEFLQALYCAQSPRYRDVPYLIVLDEMNLSHPEQYFADLISALEQDEQKRRLHLMPSRIEPAPLLLENGRTLKVPTNVWFIGTANHDETTKDFAEKTYDRAHVMELPRHHERFKVEMQPGRMPLGIKALKDAFGRARERHAKEAAEAYSFLERKLADPLGTRFRISWGNRLERQMKDYVPVVLAAGGSMAEATDHVLATKLLRRLRGQHDVRPSDLTWLRELLTASWSSYKGFADKPPTSSLALLDGLRGGPSRDEDEEAVA